MRSWIAITVLFFLGYQVQPVTAQENSTQLSPYQNEAIKSFGATPPSADAMAVAQTLMDRKFQDNYNEKHLTEQLVQGWTYPFVSKEFGLPCDVVNAYCLARARSLASELAPILRDKYRQLGMLMSALQLASRYTPEELTIVREFIGTTAGAKISAEAIIGSYTPGGQWDPVVDDVNMLINKYRRQFVDETRMLPRVKSPKVRRSAPPKVKP